jgi:hypothetical protein
MLYIDTKYLSAISGRLRNFKQKSQYLWNASCPVCGASHTKVNKARLYFFRHNNKLIVKCHNCQYSASFSRFLQYVDPSQHKDYTFEKFKANKPITLESFQSSPSPEDVRHYLTQAYREPQALSIPSIASLPEGHYAKAYIASRKVPEKYWPELYFAEDYVAFLKQDFPATIPEDPRVTRPPADDRIVIPFINEDNYITHLTGRSILTKSSIRYATVTVLNQQKVYGLNRLDDDQPFYVVEGPIDSLFLPNAVACGDANLMGTAAYLKKIGYERATLIFDNEPRSKVIVKQMQEAIEKGYKIAILPYHDRAKDLNEMVMNGSSLTWIKEWVEGHTFQGHMAMLELGKWRKC